MNTTTLWILYCIIYGYEVNIQTELSPSPNIHTQKMAFSQKYDFVYTEQANTDSEGQAQKLAFIAVNR